LNNMKGIEMEFLFGVDIGGTNIKLGIVKNEGDIVVDGEIPTESGDGPAAAASRVKGWLDENRPEGMVLRTAGVGCAGFLDSSSGFLHFSPNLPGWTDVPLTRIFSEALSVPVVIENDANCAAFGEFKLGAGRDMECFACVTLGTGVGCGIITDGRVFHGCTGLAGEVGHMIVLADGPPCSCGSRGCLEALIGAGAIVQRARKLLADGRSSIIDTGDKMTVEDISNAAGQGDRMAIDVFEETGHYLGIGLVNIVRAFDPNLIAIGGGVARAGEVLFEPAERSFREHITEGGCAVAVIRRAELGNKAAFLGAALLSSGIG